ncbi:MAG TPA: TerB family tellurite resistance protein [Bacteroidia bacterium]|jgi:uncharacterized tellurite resistance protein B-like protein
MTPLENLHYAIGQLAYAIAQADGAIQKEEREKFHALVAVELRCKDYDFDISDIIFQILDKDNYTDARTSYESAMKEIRLNSHYLSPNLKETFIKVITKVAKAYPPISEEEESLLERFKKEIATIEGDPVYYESSVRK